MKKYVRALAIGVLLTAHIANADEAGPIPKILDCVAQNVPERTWNGIDLAPARILELQDGYIFVHGDLGWHLTWGVLFETKDGTTKAYETYGSEGDMTGAFGRMEVPHALKRALVECGVDWGDLWPNAWPEQRRRQLPQASEPIKPLSELPIEELLPPKR